ncbi:hypothetical protein INR49_025891 [Caranx melampygus]|nr:hypothetical protein INR49_025891 [Caranx melampygus]
MFETRGIPFVLLDIACLILGGLPLAAFNLGKIRPYQRGFFCNDESIKYPFHHSTITSTVLYTVGFTLPISCLDSHLQYSLRGTVLSVGAFSVMMIQSSTPLKRTPFLLSC